MSSARLALGLALLSAALAHGGCAQVASSSQAQSGEEGPVYAARVIAYDPVVAAEVTVDDWPYFFAPEAALGGPDDLFGRSDLDDLWVVVVAVVRQWVSSRRGGCSLFVSVQPMVHGRSRDRPHWPTRERTAPRSGDPGRRRARSPIEATERA